MGFFKNITKNFKVKNQFIVFFLSTAIISLIISFIFISLFLVLSFNKKVAFSNEEYAINNTDKILNESFKNDLNHNVLRYDFNYWVILRDNTIVYSSVDDKLPMVITIKPNRYRVKVCDKNHSIFVFTPLISNNKIVGGFVQRYESNFLFELNFVDNFMQKIGPQLFSTLTVIILVVLVHFITLLSFSLIFSSTFNKSFNEVISISNKIKSGRLDFTVDSSYNNEIGDVLLALDDSLKSQWLMTEQRKDMILSLTHDIKTPIAIIYGPLELLSGNYGAISDNQKDAYIRILLNNAEKVKTLINQLNEVWDLERPNLSLNFQEVNLNEFLSYIEENLAYICNEKNIELTLSYLFSDEQCSIFDPFRIDEVLSNLVSNSLKYTKENDEILIESYFHNGYLVFKVSDTGKGFTCDTDIIFNKHYKETGDNLYKNSSGLGLYICKLIVDKHNGSIKGYNNDKGGATVEFYLPSNIGKQA